MLWFYILFINVKMSSSGKEFKSPTVTVGSTTYVGSYLKSWNSDLILSFRGIRYAQPPIGELRFKDPKPFIIDINHTEYDATKTGNDCPSIYAVNPSEDCLFLNVYTKSTNIDKMRPVIVFIHPGGFYVGSSSSSNYGPEYLLTEDIVLVTFNYRLGTLGFLNLDTKDYPGNAGLKDQVLALRWVNENIRVFGGNPQEITLMGYSAGAFSVSLHLVSPMSRGLFQQAIIMSGSIPPQLKLRHHQLYLALRQIKILGYENNEANPKDIVKYLNKFDGNQISGTLRSMFDFGKDNPIFLWQPILENDYGQERFLIEDPYTSLKNGNFAKVPILTGFTNNEFCTSAADILFNESLRQDFDKNFSKLAPICFMYNDAKDEVNDVNNKIIEKYFNKKSVSSESLSQLCDLFSDSIIRFGIHRLAEIASEFVPKIQTYRFAYLGRFTNLKLPEKVERLKGAEHMDDLMYLFKSDSLNVKHTDAEAKIISNMIEFITSFAMKRAPEFLKDNYEKWNMKSNTFLEITEFMKLQDGTNFDRYEFWNQIFPK